RDEPSCRLRLDRDRDCFVILSRGEFRTRGRHTFDDLLCLLAVTPRHVPGRRARRVGAPQLCGHSRHSSQHERKDHQQRTQPEGNLDRNSTTIHIPRSNTLATGPPPDRNHEGPDSACRIKDSNPDNTESPVTTAYNTAANAAAAMDPIAYSTVDIPESPP